jgi:hypothetical protein
MFSKSVTEDFALATRIGGVGMPAEELRIIGR